MSNRRKFITKLAGLTGAVTLSSYFQSLQGQSLLASLDEARNRPEWTQGIIDALAWFDQGGAQVDLVLTDVVMPEMRGPTLVEHLLEIRPDLPHVFMTGHPKDEPLPLGSGLADAADIITKPFDSVTLLSTVRGALSRPRI